MNWGPTPKKIVLGTGKEYAFNSGTIGGLNMEPAQVIFGDDTAPEEEYEMLFEEPGLALQIAFLEKVGFESLWDDEV